MVVVHLLAFAAQAGLPAIGRVTLLSGPAAVNRRTEFAVELKAKYDNPYNPSDVALDAVATSPSGKKHHIPGFFYRPYARSVGKGTMLIAYSSTEALNAGKAAPDRSFENGEILTPSGPASWRVRFTPVEAGKYRFSFVLKDRRGVARKDGPPLNVGIGKSGGFVRVDPANPTAFRLSTGQGFYPLGANIGWAGERGTRDYDDWLTEYGKAGANWGRVWLSPSWTTFALEQPHKAGEIDLANAWRLDYALDLASRKGIRLALCIDSYNVLRDKINWPEWDRSPYKGMISKPADFWTDPKVAQVYRNKLRYLVARWGADPSVFSWEFWNEVDGISDYKVGPVREWHRQMASYLRSIDPNHHLISTSFGGSGSGAGDAEIFALPGIDYSVSHMYDAPDGPAAVALAQKRLGTLGKPHFVAEFGADASGDRSKEDPNGLQLHDSLWSSLAVGSSGASMLWWWDSYIHPRHLYPQLTSVKSFMNGIDWGRAHLEETGTKLEFVVKPTNASHLAASSHFRNEVTSNKGRHQPRRGEKNRAQGVSPGKSFSFKTSPERAAETTARQEVRDPFETAKRSLLPPPTHQLSTLTPDSNRRDIILEGGVANWSPSAENSPRTIQIDKNGAHGGPIAGFLHGVGNHADLHNPVTFETDLPWPTVLEVQVGDVSGYGGAGLVVTLDGKKVVKEIFPDPDEDHSTTTLKQFAGSRSIPLPAGRHRVVVENPGQDWVRVDYRFMSAAIRTSPPLVAWASAGPDTALAWVRHEDRSWRNVIERKIKIVPAPPSILVVRGLRAGVWKAVLWDTWKGKAASAQQVVVRTNGEGRISLPPISTDLAIRLERLK